VVTRSDSRSAAPNPAIHRAGGLRQDYRSEWTAITTLGWTLTGSWPVAELAQDAFAGTFRRWDEIGGLDRPGARCVGR
jgi:hypothetical protein